MFSFVPPPPVKAFHLIFRAGWPYFYCFHVFFLNSGQVQRKCTTSEHKIKAFFFLDGKNKTSQISILFLPYFFFSQNLFSTRMYEIFRCLPKLHCVLEISYLLKTHVLLYRRWRRCSDSSERCFWVNPGMVQPQLLTAACFLCTCCFE